MHTSARKQARIEQTDKMQAKNLQGKPSGDLQLQEVGMNGNQAAIFATQHGNLKLVSGLNSHSEEV